MAKVRFPGKALKLNTKKRICYNSDRYLDQDARKLYHIKSGLILFNELFDGSDESDDSFEGFRGSIYEKSLERKNIHKSSISEGRLPNNLKHSHVPRLKSNLITDSELITDNQFDVSFKPREETCHKFSEHPLPNSDKKEDREITERKSKKFVLPVISNRSSRVIKPNAKFSDDLSIFSPRTSDVKDRVNKSQKESSSKPIKLMCVPEENASDDDFVCRSITRYTDCITEEFKGHVGRPSKNKKGEMSEADFSPGKIPKEDRVKEKIEKLLKSPWKSRKIQNSMVLKNEDLGSSSSKSILRKPRLNLNKRTLQKIRSQSHIQELVSVEETSESKCGLCQLISSNTVCRYGVFCCEHCLESLAYFTENSLENIDCTGGKGECQLFGLSFEEKCTACWLCRILHTCTLPNLLHDRLRKYLPPLIKDKVPTSLSRSFNLNSVIIPEISSSADSATFSGFGSFVDLPGGWKRIIGEDVVVISPSGEKFKSISKLEEYLVRQGINVNASFLFGNARSKDASSAKSITKSGQKTSKSNNVVVTTLPGGWSRRIKWRNVGGRFDTYVCSPDGRTFRSKKELSAYFQHIGKVDDIHKYFPVNNEFTSYNSGDNSEISSTEPLSSSEASAIKTPDQSDDDDDMVAENPSSKCDTSKLTFEVTDKTENIVKESAIEEDSFSGKCSDSDFVPSIDLSSLSELESSKEKVAPVSETADSLRLKKSHKHKKKKKRRGKFEEPPRSFDYYKEKKVVFKIGGDDMRLPKHAVSSDDSMKKSKHRHKSKQKSTSHLLDNEPLICDVDKLLPKVTEEKENILDSQQSNTVSSHLHSDLIEDHSLNPSKQVSREDNVVPLLETNKTNKKQASFTTEAFGHGWLRKVKWNDKGVGKISFLTSPEGQKIVSSIELLAYFKKSGSSGKKIDVDYYFPKTLIRTRPESGANADPKDTSSAKLSSGFESQDNKGEPTKFRSLSTIRAFIERKKKERLLQNQRINATRTGTTGPRVKNVCRTQAQVLGMPRAVFPRKHSPLKRRKFYSTNKLKRLSIHPDKKIWKKTRWCKKCVGCRTPECRVCVNCLDKKKFGGKNVKRKSCIMRKCYNPRRVFKSTSKLSTDILHQLSDADRKRPKEAKGHFSFSNAAAVVSAQDRGSDRRSIFIPKAVKPSTDSKEKGDIETGKEFTPGTLLDVDYWEEYDADEMLTVGFPIISSGPLPDISLCFRCGSAGLEELLYCIWCCEGIHPFCLEEGEGPESEEEEVFWVCKRCTACHVCGGADPSELLRCGGCRKHYHLECLGPDSHAACQPSVEGIWDSDPGKMLSYSWPGQLPLVTVDTFDDIRFQDRAFDVLLNLDPLDFLIDFSEEMSYKYKEECIFLPTSSSIKSQNQSPSKHDKSLKDNIVQSIQIEDSFANLEEGDHICLEDLQDLVEPSSDTQTYSPPSESEILSFFRNIDLFPSETSSQYLQYFADKDEYLTLNYKYIRDFGPQNLKSSLSLLLRNFLTELFVVQRYQSVFLLKKQGLIPASYFNENDIDGEDFELTSVKIKRAYSRINKIARKRRLEAKEEYLTRKEMKRIMQENKLKDRNRRQQNRSKLEINNVWEYSEYHNSEMSFIDYNYHPDLTLEDLWQPQTWDEFDSLMAFTNVYSLDDDSLDVDKDKLESLSNIEYDFQDSNVNTKCALDPNTVKLKSCFVKLVPLSQNTIDIYQNINESIADCDTSLNSSNKALGKKVKKKAKRVSFGGSDFKDNKNLKSSHIKDTTPREKSSNSQKSSMDLKRKKNNQFGLCSSKSPKSRKKIKYSDLLKESFDCTENKENPKDTTAESDKNSIEPDGIVSPITPLINKENQTVSLQDENKKITQKGEVTNDHSNTQEVSINSSLAVSMNASPSTSSIVSETEKERSSSRLKGKSGRASELASMRKAMLD